MSCNGVLDEALFIIFKAVFILFKALFIISVYTSKRVPRATVSACNIGSALCKTCNIGTSTPKHRTYNGLHPYIRQ